MRSCNGYLLNQPSERVQHGPLKLPTSRTGHEFQQTCTTHLLRTLSPKLLCLHKSNFLATFAKNTPWGICAPQRGWWEGGVPRRFWK
ncbi:hypothetical protein CDAR_296461 [Caerostris darwini]|uniref:Uncharacterized protein n=1 Tax=Caerostris darwini TaxID=1538125 RepID=A0AAV4PNW7_9ARAC|nr:hypothetical protein CDAR_296461 [Caerostris darwini]